MREAYRNKVSMDYVRGRLVKATVCTQTGNVLYGLHLYNKGNTYGGEMAVLDGLTDPYYAELDDLEE